MTSRIKGQNCKFFTTPLSRNSQKRLKHKENQNRYRKMTRKPRSHVRILIYRTRAIGRRHLYGQKCFLPTVKQIRRKLQIPLPHSIDLKFDNARSHLFHPSMWDKTNIVELMHVTQYKSVATSIIILWANQYVSVMRHTADHVDARPKAVCNTMENHVITPCALYHHACEIRFPR